MHKLLNFLAKLLFSKAFKINSCYSPIYTKIIRFCWNTLKWNQEDLTSSSRYELCICIFVKNIVLRWKELSIFWMLILEKYQISSTIVQRSIFITGTAHSMSTASARRYSFIHNLSSSFFTKRPFPLFYYGSCTNLYWR